MLFFLLLNKYKYYSLTILKYLRGKKEEEREYGIGEAKLGAEPQTV